MIKRLDIIVPKFLEKMNIPGVAIAFISKSEISSIDTFGYANKEKKIPITEKTIFEVASISKSVSAWGIMRLVEKGLIDLDAPVEKYLNRWHLPPSEFDHNEVTIRKLLSHTAGFLESEFVSDNPKYKLLKVEELLSGKIPGPIDDNELKYCKKWNLVPRNEGTQVTVKEQPGKKYMYANDGYSILQLVVEEITKQSFPKYMNAEILKPLGMNSSSFESEKIDKTSIATPYDEEGKPLPQYRSVTTAAGGLWSTIKDLPIFTLSGMKGSKGELPGRGILHPNSINEMYTKIVYATNDFGYEWYYGLGHFITEIQGLKVIQHSGGIIGWRSMMLFIPEIDAGIVILINSSAGNPLWANLITRWSREILKSV